MAKILIVMCLANDDDDSMKNMSIAVGDARKNIHNDTVTTEDFADLVGLDHKGLKSKLQSKTFDEIIFCGHSRFFLEGTDFKLGKYIVENLGEREVGGYSSDVIIKFINLSLDCLGATTFTIFCCESALNVASHQLDSKGTAEIIYDLTSDRRFRLRAWIKGGLHEKVSLVQEIALRMQSKFKRNRSVVIRGMNGVGYISPDDGEMLTFSQEYADEQKKVKNKKQDKQFMKDYVLSKSSPHVIGYRMTL